MREERTERIQCNKNHKNIRKPPQKKNKRKQSVESKTVKEKERKKLVNSPEKKKRKEGKNQSSASFLVFWNMHYIFLDAV